VSLSNIAVNRRLCVYHSTQSKRAVTLIDVSIRVKGCCTCSDSLDGRQITDIERQFLKNWKVMHKAERRLMAPPGEPAPTAQMTRLPVCSPKLPASSSSSTEQESMLVVSARQSASQPTNVERSLVPCSSVSARQPLHYDSQLFVFGICHLPVIFTLLPVHCAEHSGLLFDAVGQEQASYPE